MEIASREDATTVESLYRLPIMPKATNAPTHRTIIPLPSKLLGEVDDYRFSRRLDSRAEAIRELLELGLAAKAAEASPNSKA